ncbi:MAG TPA: hypothetical protein VJV04_07950, partial [Nitrospiraceae bacterium]|nr:hypothetical protein [Nitrospiraceae bacterium]
FPVDRLETDSRCLLADVIDHPDASGVIGPDRTPIGVELYTYLLDHPAMTAMLMHRMGLGSFQITEKGPNRYWVDDGDGAEGLLFLVFRDAHTRIYYIDGQHRSTLFPTIKAKTAIFMQIAPGPNTERSTVQTTLASYTRFEEGMLSRLMHLFQPLVTRAVNRTLAKEFSMTHRLGILITEQPQRILEEAADLSEATPDDRQSLLALLRAEVAGSHPADPPQ